MPAVVSTLFLLAYLVGLAIFLLRYRGTRAYFPGVVTFVLLVTTHAGHELARWLDLSSEGRRAAWATVDLIYLLAMFCLVGTFFSLAEPERGGKARPEIAVWAGTGALALLVCSVTVYIDYSFRPWWYFLLLSRTGFVLGSVAVWRRFRSTVAGFLAVFSLAGLWLSDLTRFLAPDMRSGVLVAVLDLSCWAVVLWFLAAAATDPRTRTARPGDFPPRVGPDPRPLAAFRCGILLVLPFFYWQVYEVIAGGPVTSHYALEWGGIFFVRVPLPLILLVLSWGGACLWLRSVFTRASKAPLGETGPPKGPVTKKLASPPTREKPPTPIVVTCQCQKRLRLAGALAGKRIRCPVCGHVLRVPTGTTVGVSATPQAPAKEPPAPEADTVADARQPPAPLPDSSPGPPSCCPHCGARLPASRDAFCPECRSPLQEDSSPEGGTGGRNSAPQTGTPKTGARPSPCTLPWFLYAAMILLGVFLPDPATRWRTPGLFGSPVGALKTVLIVVGLGLLLHHEFRRRGKKFPLWGVFLFVLVGLLIVVLLAGLLAWSGVR